VVRTREPGGTPIGERVRELLLTGGAGGVTPFAEVHLFAAARAQLVAAVVRPALAQGAWVVSDRFLDSSLAYQGGGRELGIDAVLDANRSAVDGCLPDLALVIELPVGVARARRCAAPDRIEAEGDAFAGRVAAAYAELAGRFPARVRLIDGAGEPEAVHARVVAAVEALP
jgi:dTMP kinase